MTDWIRDYRYAALAQARHVVGASDTHAYLSGDEDPVVLLPGVFESWQFLRPVADRLHDEGHPIHVVHALGINRRSVPEGAARAMSYLREHDLRHVVLVAHSKGGLIGKRMMTAEDREGRIERMVTVNTPFSGSAYARYAVGRTLREFRPRGRLVRTLARERAVNTRITSLYSSWDPVIPGGSELPGAENVRLPMRGHFHVLADPRVLDEIAERV